MAAQTQDELNKRLDVEVDALLENLTHIVEAASLRQKSLSETNKLESKDRYKIAQDKQLMEGSAANLVNSAESLLSMTADLKQALLLTDFRMINTTLYTRYITVKDRQSQCDAELVEFQTQLRGITSKLEDALSA
ncbi:mediator complex, subunit Med22 [Phlyctochytrium arcticum]|nr:mediator complex, subunit Med22 [Phlyctochytrium arcticum]